MRLLLPLLGLALAALAAGCGGTKTVTVERTTTVEHTVTQTRTVTAPTTTAPPAGAAAAPCPAGSLSGTFAVVRGSAGAGQIVYRLRLVNTGSTPCRLSGLPVVQLLDAQATPLPTHPIAAHPGEPTAVMVTLAPAAAAVADARFSPDVPGTGDRQGGQCQPTASTLRVTAPGGGTLDAPIRPPTPVCERGTLQLSVYSAG